MAYRAVYRKENISGSAKTHRVSARVRIRASSRGIAMGMNGVVAAASSINVSVNVSRGDAVAFGYLRS